MSRDFGSELPPSYRPDDVYLPPPAWPKAIGVVSIVVASISVGCAACGVVSVAILPMILPQDAGTSIASMPSPYSPLFFTSVFSGVVLAAILLVAGITTISRRPIGRTLHLVYGVLALPAFALGLYVTMEQQEAMKQWAAQNPGNEIAKAMTQGSGRGGQLFGYAIHALLGLVYPLFLLVWFGLVKRRASDMLGTDDATPPAA